MYLRKVAAALGLGALIFALSMPVGMLLELLGLSKVAAVFMWPFLVLKPLIPCLPLGSPNCEGDAFLSGMYRWSIALGIGVYAILSHVLLTVTRKRPLTIGSSDRGGSVFGEPRRGSMIGINQLRWSATHSRVAQPHR
jgi:hypothetical protein